MTNPKDIADRLTKREIIFLTAPVGFLGSGYIKEGKQLVAKGLYRQLPDDMPGVSIGTFEKTELGRTVSAHLQEKEKQ